LLLRHSRLQKAHEGFVGRELIKCWCFVCHASLSHDLRLRSISQDVPCLPSLDRSTA
jgi:hypothetical protein